MLAYLMSYFIGFCQHDPLSFLGACVLAGTTAISRITASGGCSCSESCLARLVSGSEQRASLL